MWFFLKNYLGKDSYRPPRRLLFHLRGSFGLFLPQVANYTYSLLDRSMLKWITGSTDYVTIYDQGQRLIRAISAIMQSVGYVMMARLSNLQATQNTDDIKKHINQSLNLTLFFALPIMFGLASVVEAFVPLFLGAEYYSVIDTLRLLCPLVITLSVNSVLGVQLLVSIGREKQYTIATTTGAIVNIAINLILLPSINVAGACISSLCAEIVVLIILSYFSKDYLSFSNILKDNTIPFFTSMAMYFIILLLGKIDMPLLPKLFIEVGTGCVIYFIVMLLTKNQILFLLSSKFVTYFIKSKVNGK
jgi:O-antigen/teichoic acid export membrane protein